ncbi:YbaB/EbfC family nucleoid-associated protein [Nocardia salmonicida]|uniref:YbaB/EbfC family nucleoid-associated protein n=1 Tax=Nocardia salmonicida TaxID=53431 RepID=UPI003CEC1F4D
MTDPNDRLRIDAAQVLDDVHQLISGFAAARQQHQALTASASAEGGRITVVADASGAVMEVIFDDFVDDLSYQRIARGTLQAAQRAATAVKGKAEAILTPLQAMQARLPKLSDLFDWMPREDPIPPPPAALLTRPGEREPMVTDGAASAEAGPDRPLDDVIGDLVELQNQRARLYATGAAEGRRILVAVNADGVMIDLKFAPGVSELEYDEIAAAITAASRVAVAGVARKVAELYAPAAEDRPPYPGPEATLAHIDLFREQLR